MALHALGRPRTGGRRPRCAASLPRVERGPPRDGEPRGSVRGDEAPERPRHDQRVSELAARGQILLRALSPPSPSGGYASGRRQAALDRYPMTKTPATRDVSLLTPEDLYLFNEGNHARLYERLGAHPMEGDGTPGTYFAVWAPNAASVAVIGDFNRWDASSAPLRPVEASGIWEGFVSRAGVGARYKFHVLSQHRGYRVDKADPVAFASERSPGTASVVWDPAYTWGDADWMSGRRVRNSLQAPMSAYEVHLSSWMRAPSGVPLSYRDLA